METQRKDVKNLLNSRRLWMMMTSYYILLQTSGIMLEKLEQMTHLYNKTFRINHPNLPNGILFIGALFTHCRHQQVGCSDGSLPHTDISNTNTL